jgi:hypothetical protein
MRRVARAGAQAYPSFACPVYERTLPKPRVATSVCAVEKLSMRKSDGALAWLLALLLGCSAQRREPVVQGSTGAAGSAAAQPAGPVQSAASGTTRPSALRIVNVAPGRFLLTADAPTRVATAATLQHRSPEGGWLALPYPLREGCTLPTAGATQCREVAPGATFAPLSWNGTPCGPCCADPESTPIDPGVYRLSVPTCDSSGTTWEGPTFEVPATTDALERWRATSNVERASVYRLGRMLRFDRAGDEQYIVGGQIVAGSEVKLSTAVVQALVEWLRDTTGFSNQLLRRCSRGQSFGFRLERKVPGIGSEQSDIAVDLRCHSIAVENVEGPLRQRSYSYFDTSRPALLAVLREALPSARLEGDREH